MPDLHREEAGYRHDTYRPDFSTIGENRISGCIPNEIRRMSAMDPGSGEITGLLLRLNAGDPDAASELTLVVLGELHRLARH
jgi:hypothetical protein